MKSKVKGVRLKGYLLEWAESLDSGDFSYHVKEALRQYLNGSKPININNNQSVKHKLNKPFKEVKSAEIDIDDLESRLNEF